MPLRLRTCGFIVFVTLERAPLRRAIMVITRHPKTAMRSVSSLPQVKMVDLTFYYQMVSSLVKLERRATPPETRRRGILIINPPLNTAPERRSGLMVADTDRVLCQNSR